MTNLMHRYYYINLNKRQIREKSERKKTTKRIKNNSKKGREGQMKKNIIKANDERFISFNSKSEKKS